MKTINFAKEEKWQDPFYSLENMKRLEAAAKRMAAKGGSYHEPSDYVAEK